MLWSRTRIHVRVKLFTGLDKDVGLKDYDLQVGIQMQIPESARIRTVARRLGLPGGGRVAFFVQGKRAGPWHKLRDGDEVACMKPSAGG